jgi:ketosteroid isomerase-like protein
MGSADFEQLIIEARKALDQIAKGNPEGYRQLLSKRGDITLGNPFGGFARGWDEVIERIESAASQYRDGEVIGFETIMQHVGPELAYTVEIERFRTKVGGEPEPHEIALRVTCIYRLEEDGWKLLHRQADPRVERQTAQSVLEH